MTMDDAEKFPTSALLPRFRTEVESFSRKYPDFDGRGVVICIMDTGVDPSAPGLQVTSDGRPKILDLLDTSGAGDVAMSEVIPLDSIKGGSLDGLSGRKLQIPPEWLPRISDLRLGVKSAFELFPEPLVSRVTKEFEQKKWQPAFRAALAKAHCLKAKHEKTIPCSSEESLIREEALAQEECLLTLNKKFCYLGDLFDVLCFRDKTDGCFYACLDKECSGDLSKAKLMRAFRETHEFDALDPVSLMSYSFRFHDEGRCVEVVTCGSPHGTHVASIAAAHFPGEAARDGLAPGAQVIGVRIGDNRVRGMETGISLLRAAFYIAASEADLVNFSFGEACHLPNCGKVAEALGQLVLKYGKIFCSSSGNHGPALGTVGAPGGTQDLILGIAPVVFPEMMEAEYSATELTPSGCYNWSSRGPTADGAFGPSLAAPGAAIASVPRWTLKSGQLMNGSSMSAPNGCGSIAVLLSALKQQGSEYTALGVMRAVMNSAERLPGFGPLDQGRGVIKVQRAFDLISRFPKDLTDHFHFKVRVNGTHRGIYVREFDEKPKQRAFTVTVSPESQDSLDIEKRPQFDLKLVLTCSAAWVSAPQYLYLNNASRNFQILVNPTHLSPDSVNVAEVEAFDSSQPAKGPVFLIPITVIVPVKALSSEALCYRETVNAGGLRRTFISPPDGAVGCHLRVRLASFGLSSCRVVVHCLQNVPLEHYKSRDVLRIANLREGSWEDFFFPVTGGRTLEVCIARWWSVPGECELEWKVEFSGLKPSSQQVSILPGEQFFKLFVTSHFGNEELQPSAQVTHLVLPVRPASYELCPISERDIGPDLEMVFGVKLTYGFVLSKTTEVTPCFPLLNDMLYESDYCGQLWHIYDAQKRFLAAGDYKGEKYSVKLEKGDYQLFLLVKNHSQAQLDRVKDLVLLLAMKQNNSNLVDFFPSLTHLSAGQKFQPLTPFRASTRPVLVTGPPDEKVPKNATPGSFLTGTVAFHQEERWKKAVNVPLKIVFAETAAKRIGRKAKGASSPAAGDEEKVSVLTELKDNIRSLRLAALQKLENEEEKRNFLAELQEDFSDDDPELCYSRLLALNPKCRQGISTAREFISLLQTLVKSLASDELAHFCVGKEDVSDAKASARLEKQKSQLQDSLTRAGTALCGFAQTCSCPEEAAEVVQEAEKIHGLVKKWCDPREAKVTAFLTEFFIVKKLYASALRLLLKALEEKPSKETETKVIQVMRQLGWDNLADFCANQLPLKYPSDFRAW